MSLWNPSWGPYSVLTPLPTTQQLLFQPHPSSCSPHPQPLTLAGLPPPPLQATRWAPETFPQQKAACSPVWRGRSGLNLGLSEAWKGQCASVSSSATADELQCLKTWVTLMSQIRLSCPASCRKQGWGSSTWAGGEAHPSSLHPSGSLGASGSATAGLGQIKD